MPMYENPFCGRCNQRVYMAEERLGAGQSWHKVGCYTCKVCNVTLNSTTLAEANEVAERVYCCVGQFPNQKEKQIYCKSCYNKKRGPKGYGFGSGAGTLSMDAGGGSYAKQTGPLTTTDTPYLGGNRCPRCKGSVYHAEEVLGAGYSWHKKCFNCVVCNKKLDSTTCQENEGQIYCKSCYGRAFGPKGYGFGGGAGTLTNTN